MNVDYDIKLITAILPQGEGRKLIKKLKEEKNIISANTGHARGVGRMAPRQYRTVGDQREKDIVTVVVTARSSDDVFEYIYKKQKIDTPHAGILYMSALTMASIYRLPDDMEEEK